MTRIVFSKDRAMQLDAFLRSYRDHVTPIGFVGVLYVATSERHQKAYDEVFARYSWVDSIRQHDFKNDLLRLLPPRGLAIMFADDHLFLRSWKVEEVEINLHFGLHLTRCYTTDTGQPVPPHTLVEQDKMTWRWAEGQGDWGYPLGLCGQVFDMDWFRALVEASSFHSPNSLEFALQRFVPQVLIDRRGTCYRESKLVLLPWNLVQADCKNRVGQFMGADELLLEWRLGRQIAVEPLYGTMNESVHQELPLLIQRRQ